MVYIRVWRYENLGNFQIIDGASFCLGLSRWAFLNLIRRKKNLFFLINLYFHLKKGNL